MQLCICTSKISMPFAFISPFVGATCVTARSSFSSCPLRHVRNGRINTGHGLRKRSNLQMHTTSSIPEPPSASTLDETAQQPTREFLVKRIVVFVGMALTYATYSLLRATFTYASPLMADSLKLSLQSIGKIGSAFPIAYGVSRLLTGVLVDNVSPHLALAAGLLLTGGVNVAMGSATSVGLLTALWGANGLVQGVGASSCIKILTRWFSRQERGFYWALWSTSANIGGFLTPIVVAYLTTKFAGFQSALIIPGIFGIAVALLSAPLMRSSPADAGLTTPWVEEEPKQGGEKEVDIWSGEAFLKGVIKNKVLWGLAVSYFFVYLVRSGLKNWLHFWLLEARGCNVAEASYRVSGMEIGGILGTFSAGIVSDKADGRRVAVCIVYLLGLVAGLISMWLMPAGNALLDFVGISIVGFMINGPQMIIGLIGAEVADRRFVATATGVLGLLSYLGAATSGFPLSVLIRRFGWLGYFATLLACCTASVLFLLPMWRLRAANASNDNGNKNK